MITKDTTDELREQIEVILGVSHTEEQPTEEVAELLALISNREKLARTEGAKAYNRVLTGNLPDKPEYTAIGLDGIVSIYRQAEVGEAIRKANNEVISSGDTLRKELDGGQK